MAHQETCYQCGGSGSVKCPDCQGKGESDTRYASIYGRPPCSKCNRSGKITCPRCKGQGFLMVPEY